MIKKCFQRACLKTSQKGNCVTIVKDTNICLHLLTCAVYTRTKSGLKLVNPSTEPSSDVSCICFVKIKSVTLTYLRNIYFSSSCRYIRRLHVVFSDLFPNLYNEKLFARIPLVYFCLEYFLFY